VKGISTVASQRNLVRRGAIYYFRSRVPLDLQHHYQRTEFLVSLKTTDRLAAEHALAVLRAQLLADFIRLRGGSEPAKSPKIALPEPLSPVRTPIWMLVEYWKSQLPSSENQKSASIS
jgi:hypothetical protein